MNLEKCLQLMSSNSNEEKFAGMLIFTKLFKGEEQSKETLLKVFSAISANFIHKLLRSKQSEEGDLHRMLAVNVLLSFSDVEEIMKQNSVLEMAGELSELLLRGEMKEETIRLLFRVCGSKKASLSFLKNYGPKFCEIVEKKREENVGEEAKLLIHCISNVLDCKEIQFEEFLEARKKISKFAEMIVEKFRNEEEKGKVECLKLLEVLVKFSGRFFGENTRKGIFETLFKLMRHRLGSDQRHSLFIVTEGMFLECSPKWMTGYTEFEKFVELSLQLVKIEISMHLLHEVKANVSVVVSSYSLLECILFALTDEESGWVTLGPSSLLRIRNALTEIFKAIFDFFEICSSEEKEEEKKNSFTSHEQAQVIMASVRMVGIWFHQEGESLVAEFRRFLPFMLHSKWIHEESSVLKIFPISFLLPAISFLSVEEETRECLLQIKGERDSEGGFFTEINSFLAQNLAHLLQNCSSPFSVIDSAPSFPCQTILLSCFDLVINFSLLGSPKEIEILSKQESLSSILSLFSSNNESALENLSGEELAHFQIKAKLLLSELLLLQIVKEKNLQVFTSVLKFAFRFFFQVLKANLVSELIGEEIWTILTQNFGRAISSAKTDLSSIEGNKELVSILKERKVDKETEHLRKFLLN